MSVCACGPTGSGAPGFGVRPALDADLDGAVGVSRVPCIHLEPGQRTRYRRVGDLAGDNAGHMLQHALHDRGGVLHPANVLGRESQALDCLSELLGRQMAPDPERGSALQHILVLLDRFELLALGRDELVLDADVFLEEFDFLAQFVVDAPFGDYSQAGRDEDEIEPQRDLYCWAPFGRAGGLGKAKLTTYIVSYKKDPVKGSFLFNYTLD